MSEATHSEGPWIVEYFSAKDCDDGNAMTAICCHADANDPETCNGLTPRDCVDAMREIARAALAKAKPQPKGE